MFCPARPRFRDVAVEIMGVPRLSWTKTVSGVPFSGRHKIKV